MKSVIVSRPVLSDAAEKLKLWKYLSTGKGLTRNCLCSCRNSQDSQIKNNLPESVLANAFEAIIGAIYLDGGLEEAGKFIISNLSSEIELVRKSHYKKNYKSVLQEFVQKRKNTIPDYCVLKEEGPPHNKSFEVAVFIEEKEYGRARGRTKREAEQNAAMIAIRCLKTS
ncbi:MAG: putative dsRNA-binding protein, partial [Planctomycetota bacterium]